MTLEQAPDGIRPRVIAGVALGVVVITAALVGVAWWFVVPATPAAAPAHASTLEHGLFTRGAAGPRIEPSVADRLARYRWIDRAAHLAQIPIERAIDAVVADPHLIDAAEGAP